MNFSVNNIIIVINGKFLFQMETETKIVSMTNGSKPVSPEQEELIHRLVYFQNEYEHPSDEDVRKIVSVVSNFKTIRLRKIIIV